MKSKNIFIHIPKTGGTTINCVMTKSEWQTKPDFNYRHILYETKRSNSGDIFNPLKNDMYSEYDIFTMLRNPVDRMISEYYFIKDRPEFMSLLNPIPKNIIEYAKHKQTRNYMIGFLLGRRMYDEDYVSESDLELVKNTINNLQIKVGFFEEFEKSMMYFSSITGIKWPKTIDIKRKTLNRPDINEVSDTVKHIIKKNNALDFELYELCKAEFDTINFSSSTKGKISFKGNEYDYIMKYTQRFNLLQIGLKNTNFINYNQSFFSELNKTLHKRLKQNEGKTYVILWTDCFIKSCNDVFSESALIHKLNALETHIEPLETVKDICNILDTELKNKASRYNRQLIFKTNNLNFGLIPKKDFLSILKSKFK